MLSGHTLRRNVWYNEPFAFHKVNRYSVVHDDGSREVAVSGVDFLLGDSDAFIRNKYVGKCTNGNLNKHGLWESVLEELESTCVKKIQRKQTRRLSLETVYSIPVVGFKIFLPKAAEEDDVALSLTGGVLHPRGGAAKTTKKIRKNPDQFMLWEGKYYDTDFVYFVSATTDGGPHLKPVGRAAAPRPTLPGGAAEFTKDITYCDSKRRRKHHCQIVHQEGPRNHIGVGMSRGWVQGAAAAEGEEGLEDFLEINLTYPRYVTHIGTTGAYPKHSFNPNLNMRVSSCCCYSSDSPLDFRSHRSRFAHSVWAIVGSDALAWVSSYEVHYRHALTNKWTFLCATSANVDAFAEYVLDLRPYYNAANGFFTKGLRVRPLTHHTRAAMSVSVYGVDPTAAAAAKKEEEEANDDVQTIDYIVMHGSTALDRKYARDGVIPFDKQFIYGQGNKPKLTKYRSHQRDIEEGKCEYYYGDA